MVLNTVSQQRSRALPCATTRPDRSLLQSLKSVATTCVHGVRCTFDIAQRISTTWSGCGEVCNLFMSSFLRGASGADLSALPATYTVYGCTQRTSTSVENLSYMKGMFRSVPFSPPTPPDTRMLRSWSAPPRLSRRRRRVNGMEPVESARSAPALKLEPPR